MLEYGVTLAHLTVACSSLIETSREYAKKETMIYVNDKINIYYKNGIYLFSSHN